LRAAKIGALPSPPAPPASTTLDRGHTQLRQLRMPGDPPSAQKPHACSICQTNGLPVNLMSNNISTNE